MVSAALIVGIALWMIWRTWREQQAEHDHHHHHGDETRYIDTGHGAIALEIFEDGAPPRWRVRCEAGARFSTAEVSVKTMRPDGAEHVFSFVDRGDFLESVEEIPEPHAFRARVSLGHSGHSHDFDLEFHEHDHAHGLDVSLGDYEDAHARAHATDIQRRFANRNVTTGQIVLFGLTGGLIPCPAAITVLLLCIQLKQISLGVLLVLCFSIGLALTMVSAGVIAALSIKHVASRWSGFATFARRAPYASGVLIILVGLYIGFEGWQGLHHVATSAAQSTAVVSHGS